MHFYKTIHVRTFYIIAKTINLPNIFHAREVHAPHIYTKCLNLRNERASHYRRLLFLETLQAAAKVPSRGIRKHFSALSQCSRLHTLHIHSSAGLFFFFFFFFFFHSLAPSTLYLQRENLKHVPARTSALSPRTLFCISLPRFAYNILVHWRIFKFLTPIMVHAHIERP